MYKWFSLLSTRQRSEMVATVLTMTIILGVGVVMNLPKEENDFGNIHYRYDY